MQVYLLYTHHLDLVLHHIHNYLHKITSSITQAQALIFHQEILIFTDKRKEQTVAYYILLYLKLDFKI